MIDWKPSCTENNYERSIVLMVPKVTTENGIIQRIKHITGIDRAIFFTALARSWSAMAGVVTVLLIARFLSPAEQGYYYTFFSLVAIQVVFELGFSYVILQMAAHDRHRLTVFGNEGVEGDPVAHARLASMFQKAVRWYTRAAIVMASSLLLIGFRFFSTHTQPGVSVHWMLPWCLDVIAAAVTFQIDPIISFLEGCGWVPQVARMRLTQAVVGSALAWLCLVLHHGLFSPAMLIVGQATVGLYFVLRVHGKLLLHLLRFPVGENAVSWRREIWPLQWRIAVTWASSYFTFQLFNPVIFAYQGPVKAGQMGMSLTICNSVSAVALAWIATKAAPFGTLVATKQIKKLDALFSRTMIQSTILLLTCEVGLVGALALVFRFIPRLASRVVSLPTFSLLLLTYLLTHIVACMAYYLRAHKQEPFVWYWIWIALISCVSVIWSGKHWGAVGVTVAYFICGGLLRIAAGTYVFFKKRREWHGSLYLRNQIAQDIGDIKT